MSAVGVLTDQQIQQELEAESNVRLLYNPANVWLDGRYDSHPYPLCPDGEALNIRTGKMETTDGVTEIGDRWDRDWAVQADGKKIPTNGRKQYATSIEIVKHLCQMFTFIARLTGDEKKDVAIKANAKKAWVKFRVTWANEVVAHRDAMLRTFHAEPSNAGRIPDPPNALEMEAYEFMAEYRSGDIGRKAFVCKHDGYQTDDAKAWEKHQRTFHPGDVDKEAAAKGKKKD